MSRDAAGSHDLDGASVSAAAADPVRDAREVMIEGFTVAGHRVLAFETLKPKSEELWDVFVFRVVDPAGQLVRTVQLETGEYGRARGIPYVLSVRSRTAYRVLEIAFRERPTYATLKSLVRDVILKEVSPDAR
jgi:hypothetical protein